MLLKDHVMLQRGTPRIARAQCRVASERDWRPAALAPTAAGRFGNVSDATHSLPFSWQLPLSRTWQQQTNIVDRALLHGKALTGGTSNRYCPLPVELRAMARPGTIESKCRCLFTDLNRNRLIDIISTRLDAKK
jgi:hypothetical protein